MDSSHLDHKIGSASGLLACLKFLRKILAASEIRKGKQSQYSMAPFWKAKTKYTLKEKTEDFIRTVSCPTLSWPRKNSSTAVWKTANTDNPRKLRMRAVAKQIYWRGKYQIFSNCWARKKKLLKRHEFVELSTEHLKFSILPTLKNDWRRVVPMFPPPPPHVCGLMKDLQ